ncbi:MAG: hypothetical protein Q6K80_09600 [Thermostichus sp. DG_1_6_bins_120]
MGFGTLADTGLRLSRAGLGTGGCWGPSDRQGSWATVCKGMDLGIPTFDTAPMYGFGLLEEVVGQVIKDSGCCTPITGLDWAGNTRVRNSGLSQLGWRLDRAGVALWGARKLHHGGGSMGLVVG